MRNILFKHILTKCADVKDLSIGFFLLRCNLVFPLLELPILRTACAEHRNAASSLPLAVMVQEKNEHLSRHVEATELFKHTVLIQRKQIKLNETRHLKDLLEKRG